MTRYSRQYTTHRGIWTPTLRRAKSWRKARVHRLSMTPQPHHPMLSLSALKHVAGIGHTSTFQHHTPQRTGARVRVELHCCPYRCVSGVAGLTWGNAASNCWTALADRNSMTTAWWGVAPRLCRVVSTCLLRLVSAYSRMDLRLKKL